ncbi:MAG TPA: squalene/phytoene synthase family protein [Rhodanobacteraceae bacterium]
MSDNAADDYVTRWRDASPQRSVAWLFLRPDERNCFGALAALEGEWLRVLHDVREPLVAATKLGWWREEVQRAVQGEARHPLLVALFADARARAVPAERWIAAVDAASMAFATEVPADFAAQCEAAAPLAAAFAALETAVWFGVGAVSPRAAQVVMCVQLTANVRMLAAEVEHGRSPLPMNLLARHGLTIEALAADGAEQHAAVADYLVGLQRTFAAAVKMPGPLTLLRSVDAQRDRATLRRALHAAQPVAELALPLHGALGALKIWHAARTWRATPRIETLA